MAHAVCTCVCSLFGQWSPLMFDSSAVLQQHDADQNVQNVKLYSEWGGGGPSWRKFRK
ncbi:MAG: hypothetical protein GY820_03575 [Gammaproteobacteria bacterium]|nr:hypothetical protein [Gammaproteobacteria bacterium]